MRSVQFSYKQMEEEGVMMPVLESYFKYHKPGKYDELLTIKTKIPTMPGIRISFLLLAGCGSPEQTTQIDDATINAWFDAEYEELLQMSPLELTTQGRKERYDQIDDLSEAAEDKKLAWMEASVAEMKEKFAYESLSPEAKISYDLWEYQYNLEKKDIEFRRKNYVFNQMRGSHTMIPNMLINFHKVDEPADMTALITRISESGRAIRQLIERAKLQTEAGVRPPKFAYEYVISQSKALIQGQPFTKGDQEAALWKDALSKIDQLEKAGKITADQAKEYQENTQNALLNNFKPAYEELITWLESELPSLEEKPTGVSRHENGAAFYAHKLKSSTTTDLSAEEIHQIGLDEVKRIQAEMLAIKDQVGFKGDLKEFFKFVNSDPQFFFPNTDEGRQGYLDESTRYLDAMKAKLPQFFGILPKADLVVKRVEAFREQDGAPQHYNQGTPDGSRAGTYYVHLSDMNAMPKSTLEGVAYHEGVPGHHMQVSIAQELETVPKFRTQMGFSVYSEGWALYSEILAKEMGGYENPYYDFGRLVNEIWRAIRLVVDTGIHAKGWTEADAIQYFTENSSISQGAIQSEVRRYMVIPGQATSYKIGMLKSRNFAAYQSRN
ncbi:putative secreted protein [Daphnia sinensis]|uniref:Secreted protein n=1 Tax=Daphnia sinensis TaxID=1820382 RepID=A0AAD5KDV0_9CRUS|nr:putative secreted protein [Daphnia sinensis]